MKATLDNVSTLYVGTHYEVKGNVVSKYYFAGAARIAMRRYVIPQSMTVEYLLADHLGSTSITTDAAGLKTSELRYKPWGEVRYSWVKPDLNTTPAYELTKYTFTGQRSEVDSFGLMFYNARWYDPGINQWTQPDTIIPDPYNSLDYQRYGYTRYNSLKYSDPSGHDPIIPYANIIQGAIDFFQSMEYEIVGTVKGVLDKSINANGADLVFKKGAEVLAVEIKNVAENVNLGTLGKNIKGDYGGSIARVITSANRYINSSNTQLAQESSEILEASQVGNLQNALYTTAQDVSKNAAAQFNNVYTGIKENANQYIPPAAAATSKFVGNLGNFNLTPLLMIDPRYFKHPYNQFYKPIE